MTEEKASKGEEIEDLNFRMEKMEEMIFKTEDDVRTANQSVQHKTKYRNQYIKRRHLPIQRGNMVGGGGWEDFGEGMFVEDREKGASEVWDQHQD